MPKQRIAGASHLPLDAVFTSRAKVSILRELWLSSSHLSRRELARRAGMAYRSIEQGAEDLLGIGVIEEVGEGRSRLLRLASGHRLGPPIAALFRSEADFFPALRIALKTVAAGHGDELLAAAIVGPVATGTEAPGDPIEVVIVTSTTVAAGRWQSRYSAAAEDIERRFGLALRIIGYDLAGARALWSRRTGTTERQVREAEVIAGNRLLEVVTGTPDAVGAGNGS
jgi:DNA-binding transcriptional ArsR family regulator